MIATETPHTPVIPPPRFFFAGALAAGLFFVFWSWLALAAAAAPSAETTLAAFDWQCAQFWHGWSGANRSLMNYMVYLTDLGGVAAMTVMGIMGAIWQTAIKHRVLAAAWLGVLIGGGIINQETKVGFDRERPPESLRDGAVRERNKSYPSGHSMTSAVGYGMLGYALILPQRRRPRRVVTMIVLTGMVLAIGFSRIYLRAHWFSDVVGGWTIGVCWLFFCIGCLEFYRLRQKALGASAVMEPAPHTPG